jgi:hypothetical protein
MRHLPIPEQGRYLRLVLNGFYNYYAVPDQLPCPQRLLLPRALALASLPAAAQPAAPADVAEDDADRGALAAQPEVAAPLSRLAVRRHDLRWEPSALAAHARICAGGRRAIAVPTATDALCITRPSRSVRRTGEAPRRGFVARPS